MTDNRWETATDEEKRTMARGLLELAIVGHTKLAAARDRLRCLPASAERQRVLAAIAFPVVDFSDAIAMINSAGPDVRSARNARAASGADTLAARDDLEGAKTC
ncbi:MAG: hypothetical protein AB7V13_21115 [Pseudorhodoplanes sp.]|uniref:hypothetical protein n=1 Tax=Pseudorhodoplanes sp. TaxID=1934341 RepID=UPI003D131A5A